MQTVALLDMFTRARQRSEPLIAINTPDPAATMRDIAGISGDAPRIAWEAVDGLRALNQPAGTVALQAAYAKHPQPNTAQLASRNPVEALKMATAFPLGTILFFQNAHNYFQDSALQQAIWNCRDRFKPYSKTLVLLCPMMPKLPSALQNDVLSLDEPLPDEKALSEIITSQVNALRDQHPSFKPLNKIQLEKAVAALTGLSSYPAEQAVAMSLDLEKLDLELLWHWKRQAVEQTPGLSFDPGDFTFDDIGGQEQIKAFGRMLFEGSEPPAVVIRIEEIEKAMAGAGGDGRPGDSNGVAQDAVSVILTAMEDNGWSGMVAAGPGGSGKTLMSRALANTFGVPALVQDLGAAKSKWQGESEQNIRQQLKIIKAMAGRRAFFVATCNGLGSLSGPMLRRFRAGIWVFDLPEGQEKASIWDIHYRKFKLSGARPDDTGYSGADIRNVCELAYKLKCSVQHAAQFVVSATDSKPEEIESFRAAATGRYLSASGTGKYVRPDQRAALAGETERMPTRRMMSGKIN